MVPPKTDPKWIKFCTSVGTSPVTHLATRMLMTRLKLMNVEKTDARRSEAIEVAFNFFTKNEAQVKDDIKLLFG